MRYRPKHLPLKTGRLTDKVPRFLITAGITALLTAVAVAGYGFIDDYIAGQRAQAVLTQMRAEVRAHTPVSPSSAATISSSNAIPDNTDSPAPSYTIATASPTALPETITPPETPVPDETATPKLQYEAAGVLYIPKLALELPVLSEYSTSNLKISICTFEGDALSSPERLIIAGHNYKSHFGRLSKLSPGEEVRFQNNDGTLFSYTVTEITSISMYDHEALEQGEWDITLFTCDTDRSRRVLVRCVETTS